MKLLLPVSLLILLFNWPETYAQKLPDTQEQGVWAVKPLKVDGKPDAETAYKAFNKNTRLNYEISNDAQKLYLSIQTNDVNKLMMGGITLTINHSTKKKDKEAAVITFPVITRQNRAQRGQGGQGAFRMGGGNAAGQQGLDSAAILERRKQQAALFKEIKVFGVETITDTLVSIYNEYGIKAALDFDIKGNCTYELAIPLELLKISIDKPKEFAYSIQVNGRPVQNFANRAGGNGGGNNGGGFGGGGFRGNFDPSMFEPTYFWAKYLPVKSNP